MAFHSERCSLCDSRDYEVRFTRGDLNLGCPGQFTIVQCKNCGLVFQNPQPSMNDLLEVYYSGDYDQYVKPISDERCFIIRLDRMYGLMKRRAVVKRHHPHSGKILDVGCSTGSFLYVMKQAGWNVEGVEPSADAAAIARKSLAAPVYTGTMTEACYEDATFDVITMWDVIEHIPNPRRAIVEVNRLLKPGGIFIVATPQLDSIDSRIFGKYWIGYELPRHLTVFSRSTLDEMASRSGFELVRRVCAAGSHSAFFSSLRFVIRDRVSISRFRKLLEAFLFSRLLRLLCFPYFLLMDRLRLCSTITSVYKVARN